MPIQAIVHRSLEALSFIDTPIPIPGAKEVVIKVVVAGTNPKDWKLPLMKRLSYNSGDDMAGIIHSVGKDVYDFKPGDRVGAQHYSLAKNGSFAEYSVAPYWTTFHLPHHVSFEEAATLPVCAMTAAISLYIDMGLPPPWNPLQEDQKKIPLVIYGASTASGAFAAKYARLSGIGPLIGIAGRASEYAKTLVDHVVDYRQGEDGLINEIGNILEKEGFGRKAPFVLDAISEGGTIETAVRFLDPDRGVISTLLPVELFAKEKKNFQYPPGVKGVNTQCNRIFTDLKDFSFLWTRYLSRLLEDGRFQCHPYEVVPGGLKGVLTGLKDLKDGKASAVKYVYRIDETGEVDAVAAEEGPEAPQAYPLPGEV